MLLPEGVSIDGRTGEVSPSTDRYTKTLADLRGFFRDTASLEQMVATQGDIPVYEVIGYRKEESDLAFGTTIMSPGKVGDEYFMTRGHFHVRRDRGEAYYTQSGEGLLLLESRAGESRVVEMKLGICAFIPPDWAHRSVNTGAEKLVFTWFCATDAGHEYGEIQERGMRSLILDRGGRPVVEPNPNFAD
jgi:glucose-6-phosphate isomerase, archaeal